MYYIYLLDWFRVFPKEQILVIRMEDYSANMEKVMQKVYKFLNLSEYTISLQ